ncbi:MAG: hypothetical protein ACLVJ6_07385 [Merdibacter sp.]
MVYNLLRNDGDVFSYTLPAVDLFGKSSYLTTLRSVTATRAYGRCPLDR